tara:strand:+ start:49 stop:888 length:840 start_codon:yes stop_codon:yes gene_type:complete
MKEITFIMQGPLVSDSIKTIRILKECGNVVVSCWNTDPANLIQAAANEADRIVINPFVEEKDYNFQNIRYHITTSLNGLKECKTELAVKIRADEYFTDPTQLIKSVKENTNKITVCNFLFRKGVILHPSDHIFGGKKESLISMFEGSLEIIKPYKKNQRVKMTELGIKESCAYKYLTAESTFCLSWLKANSVDFLSDVANMSEVQIEHYYRKMLKNYYSLVTGSQLGSFLFRYKSSPHLLTPTAFTSEDQFLYINERLKSIASFDDVQITSLRDREYAD